MTGGETIESNVFVPIPRWIRPRETGEQLPHLHLDASAIPMAQGVAGMPRTLQIYANNCMDAASIRRMDIPQVVWSNLVSG